MQPQKNLEGDLAGHEIAQPCIAMLGALAERYFLRTPSRLIKLRQRSEGEGTSFVAWCCAPSSMRKTSVARLLARRPDGIFIAPYEAGEIGPNLFRAACRMGQPAM